RKCKTPFRRSFRKGVMTEESNASGLGGDTNAQFALQDDTVLVDHAKNRTRHVVQGLYTRMTSRRASHTRDFIVPIGMREICAISSYVYIPLHHSRNAVRNRGGNISTDRATCARCSFSSTRSSGDGSADTHSFNAASGSGPVSCSSRRRTARR